MGREGDPGSRHDRQRLRRYLQQRMDQPLAKVIGNPLEEVWSRGVRRVSPATNCSTDPDASRCPGLFLTAALRESTTAQRTDTTLRTGLCSSPFKSWCRNPSSFDPMIGICSEPSNFTR